MSDIDDLMNVAASVVRAKDLSEDQHVALEGIRSWIDYGTATQQILTLAGYAGTGKSYIVSVLAAERRRSLIAFCAFTGKAASVLARKLAAAGIRTTSKVTQGPRDAATGAAREDRHYCGTIHALCYRACYKCMVDDETTEPEHTMLPGCLRASPDAAPPPGAPPGWVSSCVACVSEPAAKQRKMKPAAERETGPCSVCHDARFLRRDELDRPYDIIIVDEASMVTDDVLETLKRHGIPILAVGDHGQLPPVRGQGSLMARPDLRLEKIHRQAEGNPIIALSARVRKTGDIDDALEDGSCFTILPRRGIGDWIAERFNPARLECDPRTPAGIFGTTLVSWTNKLRCSLNHDIRMALGTGQGPPSKGEVVVCLKNAPPAYNGMRALLETECTPGGKQRTPLLAADLWFTEDQFRLRGVSMSELQFYGEKTLDYEFARSLNASVLSLGALYDFGYAMTCHKMQGSQCPEVGVVIEPGLMRMGQEDRSRWIYTAITRASERLTVIR